MNLVQVLPKGRFGEMISFEFHLKNRHEKTQKPLWFLGFQHRYLFRCYLLVAGVGFEPHDLRVMSPTSYRTAPSRDVLTLRIIYHIEQSVKHFFALQVSRLLVRNGSRINITTISHYKAVFYLTLMLFMI